MISKAKIKYIRTLQSKKGRSTAEAFVAEGPKIVEELYPVFQPELLVATDRWLQIHQAMLLHHTSLGSEQILTVSADELAKASFQQHPQEVLAVFRQRKQHTALNVLQQLIIVLDGVQDPGNLGTIIRVADWFGIEHIVCSNDTADVYNPKTVQATMGSIARVQVRYTDLSEFFESLPTSTPIYGTVLDGQNIYREPLTTHGVIVMGNEGNGISDKIRKKINRQLTIPRFAEDHESAQSLNVAIATAITCSEFKRRKL